MNKINSAIGKSRGRLKKNLIYEILIPIASLLFFAGLAYYIFPIEYKNLVIVGVFLAVVIALAMTIKNKVFLIILGLILVLGAKPISQFAIDNKQYGNVN